jgi:hypothetical protein
MIIPPIQIDTRALSQEFDLTMDHVDSLKEAVVKTVTTVVHTAWRDQAKNNLKSTRSQYMNSIIASEVGRFTNVLTLVGELPNMIEQGKSAFDIKKGFENSSKKTITRGKDGMLGWYLTIPFSWAQPGAIGESQKFTGVLPTDVFKILKSKQVSNPDAKLNLSDIPDEFKIPSQKPSLNLLSDALIPEYKSIYEGVHQVGGAGSGGPIMSFRRVSNKSLDESWQHPGFEARNFADKAWEEADVPMVVGNVIDSFLDNM